MSIKGPKELEGMRHPRRAARPHLCGSRSYQILTEGLVITVEPIIAAGSGRAVVARDGWTVCTADSSAHHEHTLMITNGEPLLLTAARTT